MQFSRLFRRLSRLPPPTRLASRFCTSSSTDPPSLERTILNFRVDPTSIPRVLRNAISLDNASRSEKRRARKADIVERFRRSDADTGSPEVQSEFFFPFFFRARSVCFLGQGICLSCVCVLSMLVYVLDRMSDWNRRFVSLCFYVGASCNLDGSNSGFNVACADA